MATAFPSQVPLLFFARISAFAVVVLVIFWALAFKSSFLPRSSSSQKDLIYAVLHPLLMVIGCILVSGEDGLPGSMNWKKSVHLGLQGVALASGIFGIWTKFHGQDGFVDNFYSLHSWMGLKGKSPAMHILGLYTYGLAVATAETGLLERLTFLQAKRNVPKHSPESMVVNSLGLGLALLFHPNTNSLEVH